MALSLGSYDNFIHNHLNLKWVTIRVELLGHVESENTIYIRMQNRSGKFPTLNFG